MSPQAGRRSGLMLFETIQKQGYAGCYSMVTDLIRKWRNGSCSVSGKAAFVPLRFELGEAFQFDWSEAEKCACISPFTTSLWLETLVIGGVYRKIQAAHTKLCASRAFTALGGIAKRGIYDNMKNRRGQVFKRQWPGCQYPFFSR